MSVNSVTQIGEIGWPGFNISDRNSWVPTYGNWGGPGWSGGQRTDNFDEVRDVEPAENALGQPSLIDTAFKEHDTDYWEARGQANEAELISKADIDLILALNSIPISSMDATEMAYAWLATDAFIAKLISIDLPAELIEKAVNAANEIRDKLQGALPQELKDFVDLIMNGGPWMDGLNLDDLRDLFGDASRTKSPIVFDLDGDGVETTSLSYGVFFDHDANGFAEQTGWVNSDDGLLVMDRNGNGIIDNGTELFGNHTILNNGKKAANGFAALAELDDNQDGKIDASDAAYYQLKIWRDMDGDGCKWLTNGYRQKTMSNSNVERAMCRGGFFS